MIDWIISNKEWLFSGIGVTIVIIFVRYFLMRKAQRSGEAPKHSTTVDKARDIYIDSRVSIFEKGLKKLQENSQGEGEILIDETNEVCLEKILEFTKEDPKILDQREGKKFLEETISAVVSQFSKSKPSSIPILFVDIDDLTLINAKHGIRVGDIVLAVAAYIIFSYAHPIYWGRCGEDTFFSILSEADKHKSRSNCERVRKAVEVFTWNRIAPNLHVTCTIGYAIFDPSESPYNWIIRSLHGMLRGKKEGGNRVSEGPMLIGAKSIKEKNDFSLRSFIS